MIEIQCTSCHTRYRIDERVLPDDTPTFKCSRCGHVFNADPIPAKARKPAVARIDPQSRQPRPARPKANEPKAVSPPIAPPAHEERELPHDDPPEPGAARAEYQSVEPGREPEPRYEESRIDAPHVQASPPKPEESAMWSKESEAPAADADDPLNRTFADRDQKSDTGENLRFDFSDDRTAAQEDELAPAPEETERDEPQWEVGDTAPEFDREPPRRGPIVVAPQEQPVRLAPRAPARRAPAPQFSEAHFAQAPERSAGFAHGDIPDEVAYFESGRTHSSGFFIGMFFFVAVGFLGASILICAEPVASARLLSQAPRIGGYFARPIVPAMLVALQEVRTDYRRLKDGQAALVVGGTAHNVGNRPLHLVEIGAELLDVGGHTLRRQSVYCGNELSAKMLGEMTPREIEFSQGLNPQKSFAIAPSSTAPFLMVFINPPQPVGKLRMTVAKAVAAEDSAPATARR